MVAGFLPAFVLVFVLICVPAGWAQEGKPPAGHAGKFRIAGTAVEGQTQTPVSGAQVTIGKAQTSDVIQTAMTTPSGKFQFDGLEAGKYWLRAQAKGFAQQALDEHNGFFTAVVVGRAGIDSEHLAFRLRRDAAIAGGVYDDANEPVRDALVRLYARSPEQGVGAIAFRGQRTTNDEGHYRFGHLGPGTYYIVVETQPWYARNGSTVTMVDGVQKIEEGDRTLDVAYAVTYYAGATEASGATPVELRPGDDVTANVTLTPVAAVRVRIHKTETDNSGFTANLKPTIFGSAGTPLGTHLTTIEPGEVELGGVPPGEYELEVVDFGPSSRTTTAQVSLHKDELLSADENGSFAHVRGTLKLENGDLKGSHAFLQLSNRVGGDVLAAPVSDTGEFEFTFQPVRPGVYELRVGNVADAHVSSVSASGAKVTGREVEIAAESSVQMNVTMRKGVGRVDGTALLAGKAMAGMMVILVPENFEHNASLFRRDQSDLDGTFTLRAVVPGKYTVVAIQDGWDLDWMDPDVLRSFLKGGEKIEVAPDKNYEVKVNVQDAAPPLAP